MLQIKKLEEVKKETRSSNSINKLMRWKVSAELIKQAEVLAFDEKIQRKENEKLI